MILGLSLANWALVAFCAFLAAGLWAVTLHRAVKADSTTEDIHDTHTQAIQPHRRWRRSAAAALPAFAADLARGRDYEPIDPPQPGDDPAKIEVIEFFSYGCPHCKDLNPLVARWVGAAAQGRRLPAACR
ncbi:MAG: hypothetical protein MZW92_46825 [Comamonadaceae bacterium]|nr:hypothetical protein [Comamonadaceae bacterium]